MLSIDSSGEALAIGARNVELNGFDAARALDLLRRGGITWTFLVPTMIYRLLDLAADREDLPLRTVVYGAAPITPSRLARVPARQSSPPP